MTEKPMPPTPAHRINTTSSGTSLIYLINLHLLFIWIAHQAGWTGTAGQWDRRTFMILPPNTPEPGANKLAIRIGNAFEHFNFGQNFRLTVRIATVQHESGEDTTSTVSALDNKMVNASE